jgi:hypothetical protein
MVERGNQLALCGQRQLRGSPLITPVLAAQTAIIVRSHLRQL